MEEAVSNMPGVIRAESVVLCIVCSRLRAGGEIDNDMRAERADKVCQRAQQA
jgi:hypothetical protein